MGCCVCLAGTVLEESIDLLSNVGPDLLAGPLLNGWNIPDSAVLDGDEIRFVRSSEGPLKWVSPSEWGLAGEFAALADAREIQILVFAEEWGPLNVSRHHLWQVGSDGLSAEELSGEGSDREPIVLWRRTAEAIKAMLRMGIGLRQGRPMARADWWACFRPVELPGAPYDADNYPLPWEFFIGARDFDLRLQRAAFQRLVDDWVTALKIRPWLSWGREDDPSPHLVLTQGSLLESVLAHTLFAITGTHTLETCSACGRLFKPKRRPRGEERRYCEDCGHPAAVRDAQRDYQAKRERENNDVETG